MQRILIEETDEAILEVLKIALEEEGFITLGTLGFDPGFMEMINDFRPHVIILDYRLDDAESARVCQEIKNKYPYVPVLALSCNSNIHLAYDIHGFDDYIRKPFDLNILYKILRKHIAVSMQHISR
ncbi:response regulator [Pedobacter psychrodurus]|jgi:DNA-binding response OmpR family regulator|uniref:response regulator n=1 Tax=Pedobacter psychrodurus TaxID=2530456 RepID=UPI0029316868|nr:response regulator [Pedobacter psychrodurus]